MILKLADFYIKYDRANFVLEVKAADYITDSDKIDFEIIISDDDIQKERIIEGMDVPVMRVENNLLYERIAEKTPLLNAFAMHAATIDVGGIGVAFSARSGTGKTTHMKLWQEYLGDKMTIVNGDKPMVRFFDDEPNVPYAYGMPWNGKERYGCNMRTPLKHICFIERSETNFVEPLEKNDAINLIFNQVYMPKDPRALTTTISLINRLLSSCKIWVVHCNMDVSAAKIAYETIINDKN